MKAAAITRCSEYDHCNQRRAGWEAPAMLSLAVGKEAIVLNPCQKEPASLFDFP